MIDRVARNQAAATIRHYVCGVITNKEFEARFPYSKHDPIIHALDDSLWSTYEDISKHRLVGKNAPPDWAKQRVARWLLFLYSDVEYEWPQIGNPGLRDLQRESRLWSDIRHSFGYLTSAEFFVMETIPYGHSCDATILKMRVGNLYYSAATSNKSLDASGASGLLIHNLSVAQTSAAASTQPFGASPEFCFHDLQRKDISFGSSAPNGQWICNSGNH